MARYFSLDLLSKRDTLPGDQEHLGFYFRRLAEAHGGSMTQLNRDMNAVARAGLASFPGFSRGLFETNALTASRYGKAVEDAISTLSVGTGVPHLRSATLAPLYGIASGNAYGVSKLSRAWCVPCLFEDARKSGIQYERLIWAIAGVDRCRHHQVQLSNRCPDCGKPQRRYPGTGSAFRCYLCGGDLLKQPFHRQSKPSLAESDAYDLVALVDRDSNIQFDRLLVDRFFCEDWPDFARVIQCRAGSPAYRDLPRTDQFRPSIMSMIRVARICDVPLTLILEDPRTASKMLADYERIWPGARAATRFQRTRNFHRRIAKDLGKYISTLESGRYVSMQKIVEELDVSVGYLDFRHPKLWARIRALRRKLKLDTRRVREEAVRVELFENGLLEKFLSHEIDTKRKLRTELCKRTKAAKARTDEIIAEVLREKGMYFYGQMCGWLPKGSRKTRGSA